MNLFRRILRRNPCAAVPPPYAAQGPRIPHYQEIADLLLEERRKAEK